MPFMADNTFAKIALMYYLALRMNKIGIIGGSGLYAMEGLSSQEWVNVRTPFGETSDQFLTGKLEGREVVFLPRHGRGHRILPSELNHRANVWGMKKLGVSWIISVSAVGSLQPQYEPRHIVLIDQFVDHTKQSGSHSFFGEGIVAHVAFAEPICEDLRQLILIASRQTGAIVHDRGTYVNMEGPAFSTRAESLRNQKLGHDVIGMTNLGEARCSREAEISYATMAMVTDYDCWKVEEKPVTVEEVISNLQANASTAKAIVCATIAAIPDEPCFPCHDALKNAIMTSKDCWPTATQKNLAPIIYKYK